MLRGTAKWAFGMRLRTLQYLVAKVADGIPKAIGRNCRNWRAGPCLRWRVASLCGSRRLTGGGGDVVDSKPDLLIVYFWTEVFLHSREVDARETWKQSRARANSHEE